MTALVPLPAESDPHVRCGATNPTLGLACDREPHPPGTTHYQDDGIGVRAWYDAQPDRITAWDVPSWEKVRDRVLARPGNHPKENTVKATPARLRLLADVQRRRVYQHPDGASLNAGASGRQVTTRIAHLEGAGWVRLGEGDDYDIRYWELTDAGQRMLADPDTTEMAARWLAASGVPVGSADVRAWLDALGVPVPVGIHALMDAIRRGVIAAGDAGYAAGRASRAQALRDAYAKTIELLNAYPVPTFCAAAIETRLDDWMRDRIEGSR